MTVATTTNTATATGNGVTTTFPFTFGTLPSGDLVVYLVVAGVLIPQVENTHYTVTGKGEDDGGAVVFNTPPVDGAKVYIYRTLPLTQPTDYKNQGSFYPRTHERSFDRVTMLVQQIAEIVSRSMVIDLVTGAWDAQGHRIINVGDAIDPGDAVNMRVLLQQLGEFGGSGLNVDPKYWDVDGDGVATEFYLPGADVSFPTFYDVVIGGVMQEPTTDYTIEIAGDTAGSKIVFSAPPPSGVDAWVILRGYARPLNSDYLTTILNSPEFLELLRQAILNTLYETTSVLELGPLAYLLPLYDIAGTTATIDGTKKSYLLRATNAAATAITIRANTGSATLDWDTNPIGASFVSVKQHGSGQVTILAEAGATVTPPDGYLAKTRARGAIVTATCDDVVAQKWSLSGDLAIDPNYVDGQALVRYNKTLAAAFSSSTVTKADVTGWSFAVASGKTYRIRVVGTYQTAATTTGGTLGIAGTGGAAGTINGRATGAIAAGAAATALATTLTALGNALTTTGVSAINTPHWIELDLVFVCTASGTMSIQWASEVASSAAQLNTGSALFVEEVVISP